MKGRGLRRWRLLAVLVAVVMVFGAAVPASATSIEPADGPDAAADTDGELKLGAMVAGWGNGFVPPGLAKKGVGAMLFGDMDEADWAEKYIEAMWSLSIINGYENGNFRPNKPVTRAEAVTMLVRALGLEEEAQDASGDDLPFRDAKKIDAWARGYIAVAAEEGILDVRLDGEEGGKFQPNKDASRAWVAALLVRAAEVNDDLAEELTFTDADEIPLELQAFVRVAVEMEWFNGYPGNEFKPNKPITRAEMAAILDRFLDYDGVVTELSGYLRGTVVSVDAADDELTVRGSFGTQTIGLADEALIYLDDRRADLDDLAEGMRVQVRVVSGAAVFVDASSRGDDDDYDEDEDDDDDDEEFRLSGRIDALDTTGTWHITVAGTRYTVDDDVEVEDVDGDEIDYEDLEVGWWVRVEGEEDDDEEVVSEIRVITAPAEERLSATLYGISDEGSYYELDFVDEDGDRETGFRVDDDLRVYYTDDDDDENNVGLAGLQAGDQIELVYEDDDLVEIELMEPGFTVEGAVTDIDLMGTSQGLTIDRTGSEGAVSYEFAADVDVADTVSGVVIDELDEISEGDEVTLTVTAEDEIVIVLVTEVAEVE